MVRSTGISYRGLRAILSADIVASVFMALLIIWAVSLGTGAYHRGIHSTDVLITIAIVALLLRLTVVTMLASRKWWSRYACIVARVPLWSLSSLLQSSITRQAYYLVPALTLLICWDVIAMALLIFSKRIRDEFPARPPGRLPAELVQPPHGSAGRQGRPGAPMPYAWYEPGSYPEGQGEQAQPSHAGGTPAGASQSPCPHCGAQNPPGASHCGLCLARLEDSEGSSNLPGMDSFPEPDGGGYFPGIAGFEESPRQARPVSEASPSPCPASEQYPPGVPSPISPFKKPERILSTQGKYYLAGIISHALSFLLALMIIVRGPRRDYLPYMIVGAVIYLFVWLSVNAAPLMLQIVYLSSSRAACSRGFQITCAVLVIISGPINILFYISALQAVQPFTDHLDQCIVLFVLAILCDLFYSLTGILQFKGLAPKA